MAREKTNAGRAAFYKMAVMKAASGAIGPEKIARNLHEVRMRIGEAAAKSGRAPESICLVGVTKYADSTQTQALIALGVNDIGESRIQDAEKKFSAINAAHPSLRWHLIGHLQTNKADKAVKIFQTVHSINSERVATALNKEAAKHAAAKPLNCLLEVNVAGEANKYGLLAELSALKEILAHCATLGSLRIAGLMCMAPYSENAEATSRPVFRRLRDLLQQANDARCYPHSLNELSMGMTQDYTIAIEEGATMVRVGSALFE